MSSSSEVEQEQKPLPSLPVGYNDLKFALRDGLSSQVSRQFWWPVLPSIHSSNKVIDSVLNTVEISENLASILKEPLLDNKKVSLNKNENPIEQVVRKISYVIINQNKLNEVEVSYFLPLLRLIVWQLGRVDICYYFSTEIINNPDR
jgi:hypothetical protein